MKRNILGIILISIFLVGLVSGAIINEVIEERIAEKADLEINLEKEEQDTLEAAGIDLNSINITFIACNQDNCEFMISSENFSRDIVVPANNQTNEEILRTVQTRVEKYLKEKVSEFDDTMDTQRFTSGKIKIKDKEVSK